MERILQLRRKLGWVLWQHYDFHINFMAWRNNQNN